MTYWNRDAVVKTLQVGLEEDVEIVTPADSWGDYECPPIILKVNGSKDCISITPFLDPETPGALPPNEDRMDIEVYAVVVRNADSDSRGGCQTRNEKLACVYGVCTARLRRLGFNVINHHDEISRCVRPDGTPRFPNGGVLSVTPDEFMTMQNICDEFSKIRPLRANMAMVEKIGELLNVPSRHLVDREWIVRVPEWEGFLSKT